MQRIERIYYKANDGTCFADPDICLKYEAQEKKIRDEWEAFLSTISVQVPRGADFENTPWTKEMKDELIQKGWTLADKMPEGFRDGIDFLIYAKNGKIYPDVCLGKLQSFKKEEIIAWRPWDTYATARPPVAIEPCQRARRDLDPQFGFHETKIVILEQTEETK